VPKVAVVGANGQVGAELCLLLSRLPDVDLIPICRNQSGSAFLRYSGIACRHGRADDPREAPGLIADCDVVVNCALGAGTPREVRALDRTLIHNLFAYSGQTALIIHFSTVMVYGDPSPGRRIRFRSSYGRAKLTAEKLVRESSRRFKKTGYTLRLGHVCGPYQNITNKIRKELADGVAVLPTTDVASNAVYTVTIVDAIRSILAGREKPGNYDLTNVPQWTWRQLYEYESAQCGTPFKPSIVPGRAGGNAGTSVVTSIRTVLSAIARVHFVRQTVEKCLAHAPKRLNLRGQALWYRMRARSEIGELFRPPAAASEMSWIPLDRRPLSSLTPTGQLLASGAYGQIESPPRSRWPADIPLALARISEPISGDDKGCLSDASVRVQE
jgi:nucleoside-diphosphate-sugar epimerase